MASSMKTVEVDHLPTCDVCQVEFPSSKPNKGEFDGPIGSSGMWGFMCKAHKQVVRGLTTKLVVKK